MKIAFFVEDLSEKTGWGRYAVQILKGLVSSGVEPIVFSVRGSRPHPSLPSIRHYPILRSFECGSLRIAPTFLDYLATRKIVREADVIHCMVEPLLPLAYLQAGRRRLFVTVHGTYATRHLATSWRWLYRKAFLRCERIFSVSRYTASRLSESLPEAGSRILTIPLGVEMDRTRVIPPASSRESAFLTVGAIKPRKGVLEAVRALALVVQRYPECRLYIVGLVTKSEYIGRVEKEIQRLGLQENVIWKGRVSQEELDSLYESVRGFVLPSLNVEGHFEGFGLVHLEANALGLPAIGSWGCGNEDAIRDGETGFLVKQGDVDALAAAMGKLLDPAFPWDAMSGNAFRFAISMDWNRLADGYLRAFSGKEG